METSMKAKLAMMDCLMGREYWKIVSEYTKASSKMEKKRVKECFNRPVEECMMANGLRGNQMAKV